MIEPTRGPGGRLASRPLHFIWIVDCSGSMNQAGKIQALNNAIREVIPHMRTAALDYPHAQILARVIAFSQGARWVVPDPVPIEQFTWQDLTAEGVTDLGMALAMVADQLKVPPMNNRALPPVLVLISDGHPTDEYAAGLDRLLAEPWGQKSVRIAIAIGRDADDEILRRFIDDPHIQPLEAHTPEELVRWVRWASTLIGPVSEQRGSRDDTLPISTPAVAMLPSVDDKTW